MNETHVIYVNDSHDTILIRANGMSEVNGMSEIHVICVNKTHDTIVLCHIHK